MNEPRARNGSSLKVFDDSGSLSPDELRTLKKMVTAYHFSRIMFWLAVSFGSIAVGAIEIYDRIKGGAP